MCAACTTDWIESESDTVVLGNCTDCGDPQLCDMTDGGITHFVLRSTCAGVSASSLVDTGATANFASQDLADKCDAQVKLLKRPRSVRLGNNTVQMITHYIDTTTWIGDNKFAITYLVMPKLPTGVDSILSMAWLVAEDLWLHPKTKRIVRHSSDGKSASRHAA